MCKDLKDRIFQYCLKGICHIEIYDCFELMGTKNINNHLNQMIIQSPCKQAFSHTVREDGESSAGSRSD